MDSQKQEFEEFFKDDWILYFLDKSTELLHKDIISRCRIMKKKASNQRKLQVYSSPNSFFKAYKNLETRGLISRVKIRNHPKSEKFSRVYMGYAITIKGRDYITRKRNVSVLEKIVTLNALAKENFEEISSLLNDFLEQFNFEYPQYDIIYDKILLLLAQIDYENYLFLISEVIPERSVRIKNLLTVILYWIAHAAENISLFFSVILHPETSQNWWNLEKFAFFCEVSYPSCMVIQEKLLVELEGIFLKIEKDYDNFPQKVETELLFTKLSPVYKYILSLVENVILTFFVKNALQEEIVSMKNIIEKLNKSLIYSEILNTFHTGAMLRPKGNEELDKIMYSFRIPSFNLVVSQFSHDEIPYSDVHYISLKQNELFKQFLLKICQQHLLRIIDQAGNGFLEIPAILIKELEEYSREEIERYFKDDNYNDQYSQAMQAKEKKNYSLAIQIFKPLLLKDVTGEAYVQIYRRLIECYAILGDFGKIISEFEMFWQKESPQTMDFILYCEVLIEVGDYSQALKKIEEWLEYLFGKILWKKFQNKAEEIPETLFEDYFFSPVLLDFIQTNVIEEEWLSKNEFKLILNLLLKIKSHNENLKS
jgi:hypothetical protein